MQPLQHQPLMFPNQLVVKHVCRLLTNFDKVKESCHDHLLPSNKAGYMKQPWKVDLVIATDEIMWTARKLSPICRSFKVLFNFPQNCVTLPECDLATTTSACWVQCETKRSIQLGNGECMSVSHIPNGSASSIRMSTKQMCCNSILNLSRWCIGVGQTHAWQRSESFFNSGFDFFPFQCPSWLSNNCWYLVSCISSCCLWTLPNSSWL